MPSWLRRRACGGAARCVELEGALVVDAVQVDDDETEPPREGCVESKRRKRGSDEESAPPLDKKLGKSM